MEPSRTLKKGLVCRLAGIRLTDRRTNMLKGTQAETSSSSATRNKCCKKLACRSPRDQQCLLSYHEAVLNYPGNLSNVFTSRPGHFYVKLAIPVNPYSIPYDALEA